jgi:hypothetical protein
MAPGADLEAAWHHPRATAETRKRILRTAIAEIVVELAGRSIDLVIRWQGGDHTRLTVPKNRPGEHRWTGSAAVGDLVRGLARQLPDAAIAAALNRCCAMTGKGDSWTETRVRSFRGAHGIAVHRPGGMAGRDGRTGRAEAGGGGGAAAGQQDDGAAADRQRRHRGQPGLQGGAVGDPTGAAGGARSAERGSPAPANRSRGPDRLGFSVT